MKYMIEHRKVFQMMLKLPHGFLKGEKNVQLSALQRKKYLTLTPEITSFSVFFSHEKRPNQNVKRNSLLQLSAFPLSL